MNNQPQPQSDPEPQPPSDQSVQYISPLGQVHTFTPSKPQASQVKPPRKRPPWKKIAKVAGVMILLAGVLYGLYLAFTLLRVTANPFGFGKLKGESDGRVNILLLGIGDPGHDGGALSDTNIVVSVNTRTNQVAMISVPRDTRVQIPGYGNHKLNEANADGGYKLAEKTVSNTLGIPIHYYAQANFTGLKQLVDAVGGIDVNVQYQLYDPEYPCDNNEGRSCGLLIKKGQQHMNGTTALKYARCRKGTCGNDFGRAARQQEVLQKVRQKATSLGVITNPVSVGKLANALGSNIKTDLSINNMMRLNDFSKKASDGQVINVVFSTDPNGFLLDDPYSSFLIPKGGDFGDIQDFVKNVFTVGPIWAENSNVVLLNGTTTVGLATKLSDTISRDQPYINLLDVSNAPTRDYATSQIIDYSGGKKPATIKYLEGLLHVKATQAAQTSRTPSYDIQVITGADYGATQSPSDSSSSQ